MLFRNVTSVDELLQKVAFDYYYQVPDNGKELLADFYTLTSFYGKDVSAEFGEDDAQLQFIYDDTLNTLLTSTKNTLLQLLALCICKEVLHVYDMTRTLDKEEFIRDIAEDYNFKPTQEYELDKLPENIGERNYNISDSNGNVVASHYAYPVDTINFPDKDLYIKESDDHAVFKSVYPHLNQLFGSDYNWITDFAAPAFKELKWTEHFGGAAWGTICDAYVMLHNADTPSSIMIAVDHVVDLQHNTGTVFTKVEFFYDPNGGYGWIKQFLDRKAKATNLYQLYFNTSKSAQKILPRLIKNDTGETLDMYISRIQSKFSLDQNVDNILDVFLKKAPIWLLESDAEGLRVDDMDGDYVFITSGTWKSGDFRRGSMENVVWENGKFLGDEFKNGEWLNGIFLGTEFLNSVWRNGTFSLGHFDESEWFDGTFMSDTFYKSTWHGGRWAASSFDYPIFNGSIEYNGKLYHSAIAPPNFFEAIEKAGSPEKARFFQKGLSEEVDFEEDVEDLSDDDERLIIPSDDENVA